jgi:predicted nucleic acid-binding protein
MTPAPTGKPPAVTLDASFIIAYCAKEPGRHAKATAELARYATDGWEVFSPSIAIAECLYVFCKRLQDGGLTAADHAAAVKAFDTLMGTVQLPPFREFSLIARAEQIRGTYSCRRSADGIYLAFAERLATLGTAEIVTFDEDMQKQAKANAPTVTVNYLSP